MTTHPKILIVGADPDVADLEDRLPGLGYTVCAAVRCGRQAVAEAAEARPDLALIELGLEGEVSGIEAAGQLRSRFNVPVIYLTDDGSASLWQRARMTDPFGYLLKPFAERQLHWNIDAALCQHGRERKLKERERQLEHEATELREKNKELDEETQLMKTIFNSVSDGVVVMSADNQFLLVNTAAEQIAGMGATEGAPDDLAARYGTFYLDGTPTPTSNLPLVRAMHGESVDDVELLLRNRQRPEGVYISVNARPMYGESGALSGGVIVFRDITQLKKTEFQLRETADRMKAQSHTMETIFNSISDGVVVADTNGKFTIFNPSAERIVGMGMVDADPSQWTDRYGIFFPDGATPVPMEQLPLVQAIRGRDSNNMDIFIRNPKTPEGVFIRVSGRPIRNDAGKLEGGVIVFHDVTQLKKVEDDLQRKVDELHSQTRLMETVLNTIGEGLIVFDTNGNYRIHNAAMKRIIGMYQPDTGISRRSETYGLYCPDGVTLFPDDELPSARALRGESSDHVEIFVRNEHRPEGVHIRVGGRPMYDESGVLSGGVIVFRDVNRLKQAEVALEETANRLQAQNRTMEAVFNSVSDGVVATDAYGNFTLFSPSAKRIMGLGETTPLPTQWTDADQWKDPAQWEGENGIFFSDGMTPVPQDELPHMRALRGEQVNDMEVFIRTPIAPRGVFISINGGPLRNASGELKGSVIVFRDVTERVQAEQALLQAFAQGRLEVVDTILHNIGNAINSVSIGVGTLAEGLRKNGVLRRFSALAQAIEAHRSDWMTYLDTDPQGRKVLPFILALAADLATQNKRWVGTVERVESRVAHIVDIIRTQKSFDEGAMARKIVNLEQSISNAVKVLADSLASRGIDVSIDCAGENTPIEVYIQESRFHQMLVNLVKNSIEAIDELAESAGLDNPYIRLKCYPQEDYLVIDVADNGIGIKKAHSRLIFSAGYTTKKTGSGLGLHSAANFVIGSGGKIHALSDGVGKGTTMRVMLRHPLMELSPPPPRDHGGLENRQ